MKEEFRNEADWMNSEERNLWIRRQDWKSVVTYNNVSEFYADMSKVVEGNAPPGLRATFQDGASKKLAQNLEKIADEYRSKAAKGRPSTTLEVAYTTYRPYIVLKTGPNDQVVVWSWWQDDKKRLAGDLAGTFSD